MVQQGSKATYASGAKGPGANDPGDRRSLRDSVFFPTLKSKKPGGPRQLSPTPDSTTIIIDKKVDFSFPAHSISANEAAPSVPSSVPSSSTASKEVASKRYWDPNLVLKQVEEFDANFASTETRIHKFPRSLSRLHNQYGAPGDVPIGPYHDILKDYIMVTMVKNVATHHFQLDTTFGSFKAMYKDFCSTVGDACRFYEHGPYDVDTLKFNMLRDGCFLLQYMDMFTTGRGKMPPSLVCYFDTNQVVIDRDIMLLQNQLPWLVIQTLRSYKKEPVQVEEFIAKMARTFQVRRAKDVKPLVLDGSYTPPHLLGLLRFCKIDSQILANNKKQKFSLIDYCCYSSSGELPPSHGIRSMSKTISAVQLAKIGIKLIPSKTTNFQDMAIKKRLFSCEFVLPPLLLDETRLCWLVNMVAFELATLRDTEQNAVCTYLFVLAMLMDREEDVHKLRSKGIVQGELTNKETLDFFKGLVKHISGGPLYSHLMEEIEDYKLKRWMWIKLHRFFYKYYKTIAAVLSAIGVLFGIFRALFSLMQH